MQSNKDSAGGKTHSSKTSGKNKTGGAPAGRSPSSPVGSQKGEKKTTPKS